MLQLNAREKEVKTLGAKSLFRSALYGTQGIRVGWRLLLFACVLVGLIFGLQQLILRFVPSLAHLLIATASETGDFSPAGLFVVEAIDVVAVLVAVLVMAKIEHRKVAAYGLAPRSAAARAFGEGAIWGLGSAAAMFLLMRLEHGFSFGPLALHGLDILRYAAFWAIATLLVGVFEEIAFRGYVQHTLSSALGFWPSALLISAVFGATHLLDRTYTWFGVVSAGMFGLLFSLTLFRTGALWLAISFHAAFDYSQIFLFSPSNGAVKTSAHLLTSSLHGPLWLTGGTVGPEASVNGLGVLVAVFLVFNWLRPRWNLSRFLEAFLDPLMPGMTTSASGLTVHIQIQVA